MSNSHDSQDFPSPDVHADKTLSDGAYQLWLYLRTIAYDLKDGSLVVDASTDEIATDLSVSKSTVVRRTSALLDSGWIRRQRRLGLTTRTWVLEEK